MKAPVSGKGPYCLKGGTGTDAGGPSTTKEAPILDMRVPISDTGHHRFMGGHGHCQRTSRHYKEGPCTGYEGSGISQGPTASQEAKDTVTGAPAL